MSEIIQNVGFSWGFKPSKKKNEVNVLSDVASPFAKRTSGENGFKKSKRRLDSGNDSFHVDNMANSQANVPNGRKYSMIKKKTNISSSIKGQALPLARGIELMTKEQVQALLLDLMKEYPQVQRNIDIKLKETNFQSKKCIEMLELKANNILKNIPYTRVNYDDKLNDYAFVRMKPFILELLNCIVDYVLDRIPPRVDNLYESLSFLDSCTDMVTRLPRFELASNNYYYDKCLEQLSYIWCTVIEHVAENLTMIFNNESLCEWIRKLTMYNERSNGILERPLEMFRSLNLNVLDVPSTSSHKSPPYSTDGSQRNHTMIDEF